MAKTRQKADDLADQNTVGACSVNLYSFTPLSLDSTIENHILEQIHAPTQRLSQCRGRIEHRRISLR